MIVVILLGSILIYPPAMLALWGLYRLHGGQESLRAFMRDI